MRSLLSRASGTSCCRCMSCLTATSRAAAQTAASPARLRFQKKRGIVLFYSSIMTTAAFCDVEYKARRRKKLDKDIFEADNALRLTKSNTYRQQRRESHSSQPLQANVSMEQANNDSSSSIPWSSTSYHIAPIRQVSGIDRKLRKWLELSDNTLMKLSAPNRRRSTGSAGSSNLTSSDQAVNTDPQTKFLTHQAEVPNLIDTLNWEVDELTSQSAQVGNDLHGPIHKRGLSPSNEKWTAESYRHFNGQSVLASIRELRKANEQLIAESQARDHNIESLKETTPKMKIITELAVARLAIRLLIDAYAWRRPRRSHNVENQSFEELESTLADIESRLESAQLLPFDDIPNHYRLAYPQFTWADIYIRGQRPASALSLNQELRNIARACSRGRISFREAIEDMAHCLLVSRHPPDIVTFNVLITHLSKLDSPRSVEMVIAALFECHVAPSQVTLCAILSHYTKIEDGRAFRSFVRKMDGLDGGLALAPQFWKVKAEEKTTLSRHGRKIMHIMQPDQYTYFALIRGQLRFCGVERALKTLASMYRKGFDPDVSILTLFLRECAMKGRWAFLKGKTPEVQSYWDLGLSMWIRIRSYLSLGDTFDPMDAQVYSYALSLCRACCQTTQFKIIYREALTQGHTMDSVLKRRSLKFELRIQSGARIIRELRKQRRVVEDKLHLSVLRSNGFSLALTQAMLKLSETAIGKTSVLAVAEHQLPQTNLGRSWRRLSATPREKDGEEPLPLFREELTTTGMKGAHSSVRRKVMMDVKRSHVTKARAMELHQAMKREDIQILRPR